MTKPNNYFRVKRWDDSGNAIRCFPEDVYPFNDGDQESTELAWAGAQRRLGSSTQAIITAHRPIPRNHTWQENGEWTEDEHTPEFIKTGNAIKDSSGQPHATIVGYWKGIPLIGKDPPGSLKQEIQGYLFAPQQTVGQA